MNYTALPSSVKINTLSIVFYTLISLLSLYSTDLYSQSQQTFTTSGNFTVPTGVSSIVVECWGAGGGGSSITDNGLKGAGGGGGAYASSSITVTPGSMYSVIVGTGGGANSNGGNSSFNSNIVVAEGGTGAAFNSNTNGTGGSLTNSKGTIIYIGGNGALGGATYSGGGGGAAGSTGAGNAANNNSGAYPKGANGGGGAGGVSASANGANGSNYGGGGSGASTNDDTDRTGGVGANGLIVISWSSPDCQYSDNTSSGITFTPSVNMTPNQQTISTSFASNTYFLMNVVKGLTYQIYSCCSPSQPLKMSIYQDGNPAASVLATSASNTGNPCNTHPNNVFLSFTSPISGQVRVLVNSLTNCATTTISGLTINVNVNGGNNTQDDQNASGTDSWIGHIYDGMNLTNYLGYYTQTETFKENFGSPGTWPSYSNDDATGFNVYSNGAIRAAVKAITFSVRYRMNSTKRGVYVADMTSDDGNRLYVDGNLVFSDWTNHSPKTWNNVLFPLTGSSSLIFDYYENNGQNLVGLNNLVKVLSNNLTTNTSQTLCQGNAGSAISGDVYGSLPAGITLSGTGYQWTYSTTPSGARTNIAGATGDTFTPTSASAPFNTPGTYYIYRNSVLSSTNNVSPSPYICTQESNAATLVVNPLIPVSISVQASANPVCEGSTVTFTATPTNEGSSPVYQWKVNGSNVGTNSSTYSYVPSGNDAITCQLSSNVTPCAITNPAISNTITMSMVDPNLPISVSIVASENPICSGNSATFTATPINGGSSPAYQWKVNEINVGTNSATLSYVPTNNDIVSCVLTSDASLCASGSPATSNLVAMSVMTSNTISLSSAAGTNAQSVCANRPITNIRYTSTGATGAQFSGLPSGVIGSWSNNIITISGTPSTVGNYNYTITLTGGYCVVTATGSITVNAIPSAPTSSGVNVCIGNTSTLVASGAVAGNKYVWYAAAVGGTPLKTSTSNTDNTYTTTTLASTTSFWVSILSASGCESTRTQVTATFPAFSPDDQSLAGTNSWVGHVYDGSNFNSYFGNYTQAESFNQAFGGNTNCFSINSSLGSRSILTETFSVRYRMNSTKKGLYVVDLGSDDGSRLTVDGNIIYNNWIPQSFSTKASVLMSLNGASSLIYEFFENGGSNQVIFQNIIKVLDNNLNTNTSQSICIGTQGVAISGDSFGTLPTGISLSGTGYQWSYSTSLGGARTNIAGATAATFTPNTNNAPFNVAGTYYIYRNAIASSTNNVSPSPYIPSNESNAATIIVTNCPNYWVGSTDTDWRKASNWSANLVPVAGQNVEFSTTQNNGVTAQNDLMLDTDRTIGYFINMTTKRLLIPTAKVLTVNNTITTDGNPDRIYIQSSPNEANGSLIFNNAPSAPVSATVEMYTISSWDLTSSAVGGKYKWQYLSIPLRTTKASPTFNGGYIRRWNEPTSKWIQLQNNDDINSFVGHEMVFSAAKTLIFKGELENRDLTLSLDSTMTGIFAGQYIFGNPYTAAIDISNLNFGTKTHAVVYLYNTGSSNDWKTTGGHGTVNGTNPGQYTSIPKNLAGIGGLPSQIPSMQGFLVKVLKKSADATFGITYSSVVKKNSSQQRTRLINDAKPVYSVISIKGTRFADCMWLYTDASCTKGYDNGWDGVKMVGSTLSPQLYAIGPDGEYQVNSVDDINDTELGFMAGEDTNYSMSFAHTNIENKYTSLYLMDLETAKTIDISQTGTEYTFTASPFAPATNRFRIVTSPSIATATEGNLEKHNSLKIFSSKKTILIQNRNNSSGTLTLSDMTGSVVLTSKCEANSITTLNTQLPIGVYVAKVIAGKEIKSNNIILR